MPQPQPSAIISDAASRPTRVARIAWIGGVVLALLVLLLLLFGLGFDILLAVFAGVLVAIFLRTLAVAVHRMTHLPQGLSLAVVVCSLIAIAVLLGWLMASRIVQQVNALADALPQAVAHLKSLVEQYAWGSALTNQINRAFHEASSSGNVALRAGGYASSLISGVLTLVIIFFVGLYLAADPDLYVRGIVHLVPIRHRPRARKIMEELGHVLRWWLLGQLIDMTVIGILTAVSLWLLGIPLALSLGILAALFNFIPNFGPLFSLVPALLLALMISPLKAAYVLVAYLIVQSLEGYVLQPLVQNRAVSLAPVVTLTAQVLLGVVVGPMGLALATPLTAVAVVLIKRLYIEGMLGDELDKQPPSAT